MKPIEHGTDRGYQAHRRRDEPACWDCVDAHAEYQRQVRKPKPPRELIACPSEAAYSRHRRRDEKPCAGCREAHAEYVRGRWSVRQVAS